MPHSPDLYALVGVAGIATGLAALVANGRARRSDEGLPRYWTMLRRLALIGGALLAVASWPLASVLGYRVPDGDAFGRVVGWPFMVGYFDARGGCYSMAFPMLIGNAVFWFVAPQLLLWIFRVRETGRGTQRAV